MLRANGYDDAIIGSAFIWQDGTQVQVLVYDAEDIRDILMSQDGMSTEEARDFIEFNLEGVYLGPETPIFVWPEDQYEIGD
jgi:hypothetical protein|tara:strand:+ start:317 stop:559 length:243 start_codon:yes stop_codon:yes gene_type:complete